MNQNKQLSLVDKIDRQKILEVKSANFEKEMDRISALPLREWCKLFKIEYETYS